MNWKIYKNKLQKKLFAHESEVDMADLWSAIEADLPVEKKKKKRGFFWLFFLGFGLLALGLMQWQQGDKEVGSVEMVETELNAKSSNESIKRGETITKINDKTLPNDNQLIDKKGSKNQAKSTIELNPTESFTTKSSSSTETTKSQISNLEQNESIRTAKINSKKTQAPPLNNQFDSSEKSPLSPIPFNNLKEETQPAPRQFLDSLNLLPTINPSIIWEDTLKRPVAFETMEILPMQLPPRYSWKLGAYASGGVSYANRQLTLKESSQNSPAYFKMRDSLEQTLEAVHYGFGLNLKHRSGFEFGIGLQNTTINERFTSINSTIEQDSIFGITDIRITPTQDSIFREGYLAVERTSTRTIRKFNQYQLLEIPLTVGYAQRLGQFDVGVQGGVLLNLALKTKGQIPDTENNTFIDLATRQEEVFKSKIGLGYHFGIAVQRPILPKLSVGLAASFQYYPDDFANNNNSISQKYWLAGGQIKLAYELGR